MSSKRPAGALGNILSQSSKEAKRSASDRPSSSSLVDNKPKNPFLSRPTQPEDAIKLFLIQSRSMARRQAANSSRSNIEIEARLGTLISPYGAHDMRGRLAYFFMSQSVSYSINFQ